MVEHIINIINIMDIGGADITMDGVNIIVTDNKVIYENFLKE